MKTRKVKQKAMKNNDKENRLHNDNSDQKEQVSSKNTEVYDLNQYCSAANLNAFGKSNFKLGVDFKNIILSKNRSRENAGFGSPTLRKVKLQKEKSKGEFDSVMAKHGLLKDLNNLNSFNDF